MTRDLPTHRGRGRLVTAAAALGLLLLAQAGQAQRFQTLDAALKQHYPDAAYEKVTHFLSKEEQDALEQQTSGKINPVIHTYEVRKEDALLATVYLDKHRVRTLPETLMIPVLPSGKIDAVHILSFKEPKEYIPPKRWYQQFEGKALSNKLALGHDIHAVTGATLTAQATVRSARRILALHRYFQQKARP